MNRAVAWLFVLAGLLGAGGGWMFSRMLADSAVPAATTAPAASPEELVGRQRPSFRLGNVSGDWVSAEDFDGRVLLINFWATWCEPCREEMPMLDALHRELGPSGFEVVGIAMDDVQRAREFVDGLGLGYTALVGMADVLETGRFYGNRSGALPYSVLVDRGGTVRWARHGAVSREQLLELVQPLL